MLRSLRRSGPPPRSRLTVRAPASARLARSGGMRDALRASREAVADIERQLDDLLAAIRSPDGLRGVGRGGAGDGSGDADGNSNGASAADRLQRATRLATAAVKRLAEV